jgi:FMN phosphatase YigB (HAD superfamily)
MGRPEGKPARAGQTMYRGISPTGANTMNTRWNWMRDLAFHYEQMRRQFPDEKLIIVFDIDGTIIDMLHMIAAILHAYDREQGTAHFRFLAPQDIVVHENDIEGLLEALDIPAQERPKIMEWYIANFWSPEMILHSHRSFDGVLDVIRWFQLQPGTSVGLNTGRPEHMRADTLRVLNTLGSEFRIEFPTELLCMNRGQEVPAAKVEGLKDLIRKGYRIVAMIDNEPDNLKAVSESGIAGEMLLLHADTIFASSPVHVPALAVTGSRYDITELISEKNLPKHIEFVWHGVNEESILRQFLVSNVHWAELHVRRDPEDDTLVVRRRDFSELPRIRGEAPVRFEYFLSLLRDSDRGVKLDIEDDCILGRVITMLVDMGFPETRIWINRTISGLNLGGLKAIVNTLPGSVRQCSVDSMAYLIVNSPSEAKACLRMYARWGINRFSVNWRTPHSRRLVIQLQNWGHDVNIYNVPDLEAFLQAALLLPRSITSYFNFPKWFYRGSCVQDGQGSRTGYAATVL